MLSILAILALSQTSSAPLEASEPWTLSSQDDGCTVERPFDNDHAIQIGFQTTMQNRPAILLVRGSKKLLPNGIGEMPLRLDGSEPVMVHYGSFETNDAGVLLTKLFPDEPTMTRLAAASVIAVGEKMPPLRVSGVDAAIKATDQCTAKKLISWGVDPELYFQKKTATITGNFAAMFGPTN